ncbi:hypothetical protein RhiirC2_792007 [Rhizophagus irregularis]|uniref:Uncharacterized protein n=1 Tax=Rhizophagus irregularis TaxID=588596 RepID=A0A2N1MI34_9GLOM|nr:hypothetical protein RhiirC2_792007 [Rhizophagus irregularis]
MVQPASEFFLQNKELRQEIGQLNQEVQELQEGVKIHEDFAIIKSSQESFIKLFTVDCITKAKTSIVDIYFSKISLPPYPYKFERNENQKMENKKYLWFVMSMNSHADFTAKFKTDIKQWKFLISKPHGWNRKLQNTHPTTLLETPRNSWSL